MSLTSSLDMITPTLDENAGWNPESTTGISIPTVLEQRFLHAQQQWASHLAVVCSREGSRPSRRVGHPGLSTVCVNLLDFVIGCTIGFVVGHLCLRMWKYSSCKKVAKHVEIS